MLAYWKGSWQVAALAYGFLLLVIILYGLVILYAWWRNRRQRDAEDNTEQTNDGDTDFRD